jgi:hypothetical protein
MGYSAYIIGCTILLLERALSDAEKQDALDTLLFAQLAADEDCPDSVELMEWTEVFIDSMNACGWSLREQEQASDLSLPVDSKYFTIADALFSVFADRLSHQHKVYFSAALKTLAALSQESQVAQVFREHSVMKADTRIRVQLGIVDAGGFLKVASVFFKTDRRLGHPFIEDVFDVIEVQGGVKSNFVSARLNVDTYNEHREDVVQWLGPQRQSHASSLGVL